MVSSAPDDSISISELVKNPATIGSFTLSLLCTAYTGRTQLIKMMSMKGMMMIVRQSSLETSGSWLQPDVSRQPAVHFAVCTEVRAVRISVRATLNNVWTVWCAAIPLYTSSPRKKLTAEWKILLLLLLSASLLLFEAFDALDIREEAELVLGSCDIKANAVQSYWPFQPFYKGGPFLPLNAEPF